MSTRLGHAFPRAIAVVAIGLVVALIAACDATAPPSSPGSTLPPTAGSFADRPGISIGQTFGHQAGQWSFSGTVDPQGAATAVVLDVGPGPSTLRQFDTHLPVVEGVTTPGPISITTAQIPNIEEICVRFTATNAAGSSSTSPLCFPHDLPTPPPPGEPTVRIDQVAPGTNGQWTVTAYVDSHSSPTDVVLDIGKGPAGATIYSTHQVVANDFQLAGSIQVSFTPTDAPTTCIRVVATNKVGKATSADDCFSPAGAT